jgi:hypothetical protein
LIIRKSPKKRIFLLSFSRPSWHHWFTRFVRQFSAIRDCFTKLILLLQITSTRSFAFPNFSVRESELSTKSRSKHGTHNSFKNAAFCVIVEFEHRIPFSFVKWFQWNGELQDRFFFFFKVMMKQRGKLRHQVIEINNFMMIHSSEWQNILH